jgi:hypothetical protein
VIVLAHVFYGIAGVLGVDQDEGRQSGAVTIASTRLPAYTLCKKRCGDPSSFGTRRLARPLRSV